MKYATARRLKQEFGPYGVVLADRMSVRLFVIKDGGIDEVVHATISGNRVRHVKSTGTEHAESSGRIQRKADNQVRTNLREVARRAEALTKAECLIRIALAGTSEITAALDALLPGGLRKTVAGHIGLGMNATLPEILRSALPLLEACGRNAASETARRMVSASLQGGKAVAGLGRTLRAVNAGRVSQLVHSADFRSPGSECTTCGALFTRDAPRCPACAGPLRSIPDVVAPAAARVRHRKAHVETVSGNAAAALHVVGDIGVQLRTRPKGSRVR